MRRICLLFIIVFTAGKAFAQGTFSGDLMTNVNFFQSDPSIHASGNPLYDNFLTGSEGWLDLRYNIKGLTLFARVDGFDNSNLLNPTQAYNSMGIGAWSVTKEYKNLTITAGYIYDQIGSGILFRAYEDRGLLIDNALVGFELKYKVNDNIMLKALTGKQKEGLTDLALSSNSSPTMQLYAPVIRAINAEGDFSIHKAHLLPGIGILNRTLDQRSMDAIVPNIDGDSIKNRFEPMYNMYAFTLYNTLTIGGFSWYVEGAYKTHEAINPPAYDSTIKAKYLDKAGNVEYTTIGYAQKGIAVNFAGKRTDDFVMRTSPNQILLNGMVDWQPVVAHLRPGRLMSRYTPASEDISEQAGTLDVLAAPSDYLNFTFTGTHINTLDNIELYRELYGDFILKGTGSWDLQGGIQYLEYNRYVYQGAKPGTPIVKALTPFFEATYHVNTTKSLRFETEYMNTKEDYGSWIYAILEYNVAPKWSISASDMYNYAPNKNGDNPNSVYPGFATQKNHYYNMLVAYTAGPHRFSIAYVKQVDGYNCSGGVCRYEPAFNGVKATITSSF